MAMERKIIYDRDVEIFLDDLLIILFEKGYFRFPDSAKSYVDRILTFVEKNIGIIPGRDAPPYFNQYADDMKYIAYRANKTTTWYIFYLQRDNIFLITNITNNHVAAKHFSLYI